jgi:hypothetical protein
MKLDQILVRTFSSLSADDPAFLHKGVAIDSVERHHVNLLLAVQVEDAESQVAIFRHELPSTTVHTLI